MKNVKPIELDLDQQLIDDFVQSWIEYKDGVIPGQIMFFHTDIRTKLQQSILDVIGDLAEDPDQFQVFDSLHQFYSPHVDVEGDRIVNVRLNVLCTGDAGVMQFYETPDEIPVDGSKWVWDTIWESDVGKMKPVERIDMTYPALVKPDTFHAVMFDKKYRNQRRIVLSYPFYNHSWEQICEKFRK